MKLALQDILTAAARGEEYAWRQIVQAYSSRVYAVVFRNCRDGELSEEITQATFVKIAGKLSKYQEQGRFESWLYRIAMNRLRDEMRRRKRQAVPTDFAENPIADHASLAGDATEPSPLAKMEHDESIRAMQRAVAQLPEMDQQVLQMRYHAGLSFAQIAETLEQPLGTVLARGHRALKKLKDLMQSEDASSVQSM